MCASLPTRCAGSIAQPQNSPLCAWRAAALQRCATRPLSRRQLPVRLALQLSVTAALPRLLLLLLLRLSELRPVSPAPGAAHPLKLVLYELCRAVTRETLGVGKLCDLLADAQLLPAAIAPVLHSNLADVFWFLGLELADVPEAEAQKKQLTLLIQDLLRDKVLSGDLLKARLEPDMLQDVGLVKDRQDFHKKQVRMNTQQLYTQQKYNLFREQSEGYSKLITELSELAARLRRRLGDEHARLQAGRRGRRQHPVAHRLLRPRPERRARHRARGARGGAVARGASRAGGPLQRSTSRTCSASSSSTTTARARRPPRSTTCAACCSTRAACSRAARAAPPRRHPTPPAAPATSLHALRSGPRVAARSRCALHTLHRATPMRRLATLPATPPTPTAPAPTPPIPSQLGDVLPHLKPSVEELQERTPSG